MPNAMFFNGQPMNDDARQAIADGYDPSSNMPVEVWRQQMAQGQQQQMAQPAPTPAPMPSIAGAMMMPSVMQPTPQADQGLAKTSATTPLPLPRSLIPGQIQTALGVPSTVERANQYRYNPPWRTNA